MPLATSQHLVPKNTKGLFVKKRFCFKKTRRTYITNLVDVCNIFFVIKNTKNSENARFREQEPFLKNAKTVFGVMLSKTVLDVFQNKPINLGSTSGFSWGGGIGMN